MCVCVCGRVCVRVRVQVNKGSMMAWFWLGLKDTLMEGLDEVIIEQTMAEQEEEECASPA